MSRLGALGAVGLWGRRGHRCARDGPCKVKRIACSHARNVARRRSFRLVLMCGVLFVASVLWMTPASAQEVGTSFDDLSRSRALRTGDAVSVENIDGEWLRGEIVALSRSSLELKNGDESWVMDESEVVEIKRGDGVSEGAWPGAWATPGDDGASHLTVRGNSLSILVRTEPMAPFVVFESGLLRQSSQGSSSRTGNTGGSFGLRQRMLFFGAVFGGVGVGMGATRCGSEGSRACPYTAYWGLIGFGIGAGIGALVGR